jgi:hypothetical protein
MAANLINYVETSKYNQKYFSILSTFGGLRKYLLLMMQKKLQL